MSESEPSPRRAAPPEPVVSRRRMTPLRRLAYVVTAPLLVGLVRLLWWTVRFEVRGEEGLEGLVVAGRPMVLAFWHENLLVMPWFLSRLSRRGVGVTYLVSPSMDGEYAVRLLDVIGGRAVRGSATRSGTRAIRGLYRVVVKDGGSPVVTADGPRGPRRRCKKGAVVLGQLTGAPVVPLAAVPRRALHLRSWDRLAIPLPFTRVVVVVGEPIDVPRELDEKAVETYRVGLEEGIDRAIARAAGRVGTRDAG